MDNTIIEKLVVNENGRWMVDWEYAMTIPEIARLAECEQNPRWHMEGNALEHTKRVCECASIFFNDRTLVLAALFHDIGKGTTTKLGKDGNWHSYNHEIEGEKITRRLLWDCDIDLREEICGYVRWHMVMHNVYKRKDYIDYIVYVSECVKDFRTLIVLAKCDTAGSEFSGHNGAVEYTDEVAKIDNIVSIATMLGILDGYEPSQQTFYTHRHLMRLEQYAPLEKKLDCYMLVGLPGAGKDTLCGTRGWDGKYVISRDKIRYTLGMTDSPDAKAVGTKEQEDMVTEKFNENLLEAAADAMENLEHPYVVVNNINLKRKYRDAIKSVLSKYGNVTWHYVYVEAPSLADNIERRRGSIPENVFLDMTERLEWPEPEEYDFLEIEKQK